MLKREDGETEIGKYTRLADEGQRPHRLLHRDLRNSRQIEMRVMRHDNSVEQDCHNARQIAAFSKHVGTISEDQEQSEFE
jgi:hypothetical protein